MVGHDCPSLRSIVLTRQSAFLIKGFRYVDILTNAIPDVLARDLLLIVEAYLIEEKESGSNKAPLSQPLPWEVNDVPLSREADNSKPVMADLL